MAAEDCGWRSERPWPAGDQVPARVTKVLSGPMMRLTSNNCQSLSQDQSMPQWANASRLQLSQLSATFACASACSWGLIGQTAGFGGSAGSQVRAQTANRCAALKSFPLTGMRRRADLLITKFLSASGTKLAATAFDREGTRRQPKLERRGESKPWPGQRNARRPPL
jgi:hypothetical protein